MSEQANDDRYPLLDDTDVSYEKLLELERRLLAATETAAVVWSKSDPYYDITFEHGTIYLFPYGLQIYDDRGNCVRQFRYLTNRLWKAASGQRELVARKLLDAMLEDLAAYVPPPTPPTLQ